MFLALRVLLYPGAEGSEVAQEGLNSAAGLHIAFIIYAYNMNGAVHASLRLAQIQNAICVFSAPCCAIAIM